MASHPDFFSKNKNASHADFYSEKIYITNLADFFLKD